MFGNHKLNFLFVFIDNTTKAQRDEIVPLILNYYSYYILLKQDIRSSHSQTRDIDTLMLYWFLDHIDILGSVLSLQISYQLLYFRYCASSMVLWVMKLIQF